MEPLMGVKEARRLGLIEAAIRGEITNREGAQALGISHRQFKRLRSRLRRDGPRALVHGNRGRPSPGRLSDSLRHRVRELLTHPEIRVNDCHLAELLAKEHMFVSHDSVRRIRMALGLPPKRRRRPSQHRRRRLRAGRVGALVQVDGSSFHWFGSEHPRCTLVGAIDDATGAVLGLCFRPEEDLHGYAVVLHHMFTNYGLPVSLYGDGTNIFVRTDSHWTLEEQLAGRQNPTQLGRVLEDLAIGYIRAHSAQAKGRMERLWGTLQDRLPQELKLAGITSPEQAQASLPSIILEFNRRFAIDPRDTASAWRRPPRYLDRILACRYGRKVSRDNVVSIPGCSIQIPPGPHRRSYHGSQVEVRELLDGRILVLHRGRVIAEQPAPPPPFVLAPRDSTRRSRSPQRRVPSPQPAQPPRTRNSAPKTKHPKPRPRPAPDHPWRRSIRFSNPSLPREEGGT